MHGGRLYMEDEYIVRDGGKFVGVFDGHGGSGVSRYLRTHIYAYFRQAWKRMQSEMKPRSNSALAASAMSMALERVEHEVLQNDALESQGSTAVAVSIQEDMDGSRTLVSANIGDSRAVLCRNCTAVELTRDHKPSDERERLRIESHGEHITWDDYGKVYRIHGLSVSRTVGDRFAKPVVSGEVEIQVFPLTNDDEFIVLASDGLWDVMGSEYVVNFIKQKLEAVNPNQSQIPNAEKSVNIQRLHQVRRKNMSRYVASEALNKGSEDNVCVIIIWLKPINDD
jgi:serine/threonine protein phosphatase PrpC